MNIYSLLPFFPTKNKNISFFHKYVQVKQVVRKCPQSGSEQNDFLFEKFWTYLRKKFGLLQVWNFVQNLTFKKA